MKTGINVPDKWVPKTIFTMHGDCPVAKVEAFPPKTHPKDTPIHDVLTAVIVTATNGCRRIYGFDEAYIDSYLRMRCVGYNSAFSEVAAWENAKD